MGKQLLLVLFIFALGCQPGNVNDSQSNETPKIATANTTISETGIAAKDPIGSINNPVNFYFTPSVTKSIILENADNITKFLQKETGYHFKIVIPNNYQHMIEEFGKGHADVAVMNSFGYLIANEKFGARAKLRSLRYGKSTYKGQIIANVNSKIRSVKDLKNKSFAFTDSASTSGFLFPNQIMKNNNVELSGYEFLTHHDEVVKRVYLGQFDAGATFYSEPSSNGEIRDARSRLKEEYPDVEDKVRIVTLTEPIPNDPVVFNKQLDDETVNKIVFALMKFAVSDGGKSVLEELYGTEGFVRCSDMDYENMKQIISASGINVSRLL